MNVSILSPLSNSPTEGDDLCETDFTDVAIHGVTLLISLCGVAGNGSVLCLLRWKSTNFKILFLANIDLVFLLFMFPSALLFLLEDLSCSLIMSPLYLRILIFLSRYSYCLGLLGLKCASFLTAIDKLSELLCHRCLHKCLLCKVFVAFLIFDILVSVFPVTTLLCPSHEQQQCRAAIISIFIVILLLAALEVISTTINFIKAKRGSQQQQVQKRDIIMCLFVLLSLFFTLWDFLQQLGYIPVSSQVFLLLTCINSSIKPFICFLMGSCERPCSFGSLKESLKRVCEEPGENTASRNDGTMDTVL